MRRAIKKILMVDADEVRLGARRFAIETRGRYRVFCADGADEALELVRANPVPEFFDLIVCDMHRLGLREGNLDGVELVRRVKQLSPGLPALIVRAPGYACDFEHYADGFLQSGETAALLEKIRVMVARKRGPKKRAPESATTAVAMRPCAINHRGPVDAVELVDGEPMCRPCATIAIRDRALPVQAAASPVQAVSAKTKPLPSAKPEFCTRGCGRPTHRGQCPHAGRLPQNPVHTHPELGTAPLSGPREPAAKVEL